MIQVGDWVSFYRSGCIVIGCVRYTRKSVIGTRYLCTDIGEVEEDSVLEIRKPNKESE